MKTYRVTLESTTPYSQSKYHETPYLDKEGHDDYNKRTVLEHLHYDPKTEEVFIPPMAIKNCLADTAKFLSIQIPGKGKATYTKHFLAGLMLFEPIYLGIKKSEVAIDANFLNTDGVRGSGKRAIRRFPRIDCWKATFDVMIVDETITGEVLKRHFEQAGLLVGIGRFRPRNGGFYGRFQLTGFEVVGDLAAEAAE
jgi:hypothetical protein